MALIGTYDDDPRPQNPNCRPGVQAYLKYLEGKVVGEPGRPRANPEPFIVREASELVDSPVKAPEPKPARKRRRKPARKAEMVTPEAGRADKELARRLTGR